MPITLKKINAQVKDPNTGEMIPAGILSSDSLTTIAAAENAAITRINSKKTEAINQITQMEETIPSDYADFSAEAAYKDMIAQTQVAMTATKAYAAGEYICVNKKLYKTTTAITSGLALVVGTNVEEIKLVESVSASAAQIATNTSDISDLKTQIINLTGNTPYNFTPGYIATNGTNVNIETVTPHNEYVHCVIPCNAGDVFYVDVYGGVAPKSWCFIDNNDSGKALDASTSSSVKALITAPANSTHLIINTNTNRNNGFVCKNKPITDRVTTNETNIAGNSALIDTNVTNIANNKTDIIKNNANTETVTGNVVYPFTLGKNIATSGDTADITNAVSNSAYAYVIVDCVENDIFTIKGAGGTTQRLYAFLGAESSGTRPVLEKSSASYKTNGFEYIAAPENAEKLVVNVKVAYDYFLCKGKIINKVWDAIAETDSNLSTQTGYIRSTNKNLNTFGKTDGYYVSTGIASLGQLNTDSNAFATDFIKVYPGSVIKVDNCYLYGARGICAYYADKTVKEGLASQSGTVNTVSVIITIPDDCEYIRITGKIASGICTCEYLSFVADGMDEIRETYEILSNTATDGNYISGVSGGKPGDEKSCYTDFIRVRQGSHIIADKIKVNGTRAIAAYNKEQRFLKAIITGSDLTKYNFNVESDVYYIRATGAAGIPPVIYQSNVDIKDTKNFFKKSNIQIAFTHRDSVCRKIVTYVDDDAVNEVGLDLLKQSCDRLGIKCSIAAIGKILETTPARVTYLKGLELEGFHICNHSYDHSRWYVDYGGETMFTLAEIEQDLIKSIRVLDSLGFIDASRYLVYPGSSYNRAGITEIVKKWTELGCTISSGNNRIENVPRSWLHRCPINAISHSDIEYYKTQLSDLTVENENNWIIYYSHSKNFGENTEWNQTLFEGVMQNAIDNGYKVMTLNEAWNYRKSMWMIQEAFGV